jgi:hypothetical protein
MPNAIHASPPLARQSNFRAAAQANPNGNNASIANASEAIPHLKGFRPDKPGLAYSITVDPMAPTSVLGRPPMA